MDPKDIPAKRFLFLHRLYEVTAADLLRDGRISEIAKELEIDSDSARSIVSYLAESGLIKWQSMDFVSLTSLGIDTIEEANREPDSPSEFFPPQNTIIIGQMTHSTIQQASPGAQTAIVLEEDSREEIETVLQRINDSINEFKIGAEEREDLIAEIRTIKAQLASSKPKSVVLTTCLKTIHGILLAAGAAKELIDLLAKYC